MEQEWCDITFRLSGSASIEVERNPLDGLIDVVFILADDRGRVVVRMAQELGDMAAGALLAATLTGSPA